MIPSSFGVVVTGASSGIGQQVALELARRFAVGRGDGDRLNGGETSPSRVSVTPRPAMVIHCRRNLAGAEQTARAAEAFGVSTKIVQADICNCDDRIRLVDAAWSFLGRPTTWVNNAGADVLTGEIRHASFDDKLRVLIETDLMATIQLSRTVIRRWQSEPTSGRLPSMTFVGWDQAPHGMEGDAGQMFGPVKAAVMAYANSLAQEVAPSIRVNTVAPGWIQTAWGQATDSYWDGRAKKQSLMNRWGTPADVARAVCYVADPENTFCCGQTIQVNGGWNRSHHDPMRRP